MLIIPDHILTLIDTDSRSTGELYGQRLDDGDVFQIHGLVPDAGHLIGYWSRDLDRASMASSIDEGMIQFQPAADVHGIPTVYVLHNGAWREVEYQMIRPHSDYTARLRGLFDPTPLAEACVTIIGCGSGGSLAAAQLARCGVGRMRLVDYDRLELHNIARHACTMRDIGRYKTRALRDLLRDASPIIQVETFETDVLTDSVLLEQVIAGSTIVVVATDSEASKLAINRACWALGIPAAYGAAYNRAFGGDVFCAVPPDGPCYDCLSAVVSEYFAPPPTAIDDFAPAYADPTRVADLVAQPGLGMDVGVIAMLLARAALELLTDEQPAGPAHLPQAWLLFGNRAEWIFQQPLESHFIAIPKRADCPVCNYEHYVQSQLGMSPTQVEEAARRILADADADQTA